MVSAASPRQGFPPETPRPEEEPRRVEGKTPPPGVFVFGCPYVPPTLEQFSHTLAVLNEIEARRGEESA